ncbi:MAG: hypothetical protein HYW25_00640 [Candidatus Aenigmarchaeota archaeon]|nr:hypothetical protein [Candidatus Aenigmarchaeota archaeon]
MIERLSPAEAAEVMKRHFARLGEYQMSLRNELLGDVISAVESVGGNGSNPMAHAQNRAVERYGDDPNFYKILPVLEEIAHDYFLLLERSDLLRRCEMKTEIRSALFQPPDANRVYDFVSDLLVSLRRAQIRHSKHHGEPLSF